MKARQKFVRRNQYMKVPTQIKKLFLKKILYQSYSIRDSAMLYNINYSTAKTFVRQYKADELNCSLNWSSSNTDYKFENCGEMKRSHYVQIPVRSLPAENQKFSLCPFSPITLTAQRFPSGQQTKEGAAVSADPDQASQQSLLSLPLLSLPSIEIISTMSSGFKKM